MCICNVRLAVRTAWKCISNTVAQLLQMSDHWQDKLTTVLDWPLILSRPRFSTDTLITNTSSYSLSKPYDNMFIRMKWCFLYICVAVTSLVSAARRKDVLLLLLRESPMWIRIYTHGFKTTSTYMVISYLWLLIASASYHNKCVHLIAACNPGDNSTL